MSQQNHQENAHFNKPVPPTSEKPTYYCSYNHDDHRWVCSSRPSDEKHDIAIPVCNDCPPIAKRYKVIQALKTWNVFFPDDRF